MNQFDWEKHPDIDVVAWGKDGECYRFIIYPHAQDDLGFWVPASDRLPEYDIDPNTEGFDWTKSKQIRPADFSVNKVLIDENISLKDRIAELEKELQEWRNGYELGTHKHDKNLNEKLIDFIKNRLTHELNSSRSYHDESGLDSLVAQLTKEANIFKPSNRKDRKMNTPIERIYQIRDGKKDDNLNEELSNILYNDKNQGLSPIIMMGNSSYVAGFRACEKEYQRLWKEYEAYKQFTDQMYIWISASNKGHDVDFEEVVREEYKKLEVKLYGK